MLESTILVLQSLGSIHLLTENLHTFNDKSVTDIAFSLFSNTHELGRGLSQ